MKKNKRIKAMALSLLMLAGFLMPMTCSAQGQGDNFFRGGENSGRGTSDGFALSQQTFGSDVNGGYGLTPQTFGQSQVPIGSGLLVMLSAGAGYALLKRKRD